jgi:hypothetical protein
MPTNTYMPNFNCQYKIHVSEKKSWFEVLLMVSCEAAVSQTAVEWRVIFVLETSR